MPVSKQGESEREGGGLEGEEGRRRMENMTMRRKRRRRATGDQGGLMS
jgi:hypothetical protein